MVGRTCYFCGNALRPVVIGGRVVLPGFCKACGEQKDVELGEGWQQEPWARFLFADVAREARDNQREGQHAHLDDVSATMPTPPASRPTQPQGMSDVPSERQAILELFCSSKLGARKLKRILDEAGEDRSLWQVQEALRVAVKEGLRPVSDKQGEAPS